MFYLQFLEACKRKGIKPTNFLAEINMSQGNLSKWKKGGAPKADTIAKIAEMLDVPIAYLLGESQDTKKAPTPEEPSVEAMYIAELVNDLPAEKRKQVVSYLLELRQKERGSEK